MGHLERESKKWRRRNQIQKVILATVKTSGLLSIARMAPNALRAFDKLGLIKVGRQNEIIQNSRKRLVQAGLLAYENRYLRLTPKGGAKLRQLELHEYKIKKPKRWDKRWRVLIFDISNRNLRDKVRHTLVAIGFKRLQKSVWAYPYDCEDLITLLKADFKIGKDLLYMIVDTIENDRWLKEQFGLN